MESLQLLLVFPQYAILLTKSESADVIDVEEQSSGQTRVSVTFAAWHEDVRLRISF